MPTLSFVALRDVSFAYAASVDNLFSHLSVNLSRGFTGIVGANGVGKSTLLKLAVGELQVTHGSIESAGKGEAFYCDQRTDTPPHDFADFLLDWRHDADSLRRRLEVEWSFLEGWPQLSHGERKRAQIAHSLWKNPALLAIDEPTNHIDREARRILLDALATFQGVGLIVSHDRDLLDELCYQCVWLNPPNADIYKGGYHQAKVQREAERQTAVHARAKAVGHELRLREEVIQRRRRTSREHRLRSKRGLSNHDHDAKGKIDRARVSDGGAGAGLRQLESRTRRARRELANLVVEKEYKTGIWMTGTVSKRDALLHIEAGQLALGPDRSLHFPELHMLPKSRIAITGPNGSGKTTLLRRVQNSLMLKADEIVYLPQEITRESTCEILHELHALPSFALGQLLNIVSRLGSRPRRLLSSDDPSPGEMRKLLLALGILKRAQLIILDEPTNHLDLPSIEALESALAESPVGVLLVSHDEAFVARTTHTRWAIVSTDTHNRVRVS